MAKVKKTSTLTESKLPKSPVPRYYDYFVGESDQEETALTAHPIKMPAEDVRQAIFLFLSANIRVIPTLFSYIQKIIEYKIIRRQGRTLVQYKETARYTREDIERIYKPQSANSDS